jgi:hypothetical protein
MLPFLEGWTQLRFEATKTVEKGKYVTVFSRPVKGWLLGLDFVSDDAYGSFRLSYLGWTGVDTSHLFFTVGATLPPPFGSYIADYIRPSVLSTAGVYYSSPVTSAYPLFVKGLVRLELGLEADSTQTTSTETVSFIAIEVIDEKAFIRSYRQFRYGWLGWTFEVLSRIPGLKYIGVPKEIKEVVEE